MTNHQQKSLELLEEVHDLQVELRQTYRRQALAERGDHARHIADLHQRINLSLKLADVHATLSLRQAIEDAGHLAVTA